MTVADAWRTARAAHPELSEDVAAFFAYVGERASEAELARNPRAASGRLRVAQREVAP